MITLPSSFVTNWANRTVWFVRLTVNDVGTEKYLYISSLDLSGFTVQYGGNTVTPRHDYLAAMIADGGGEVESVSGVGEMDLSLGGLQYGMLSAINEFGMVFLNQGNFAGTNAYDIENQVFELWEGRLPASGTIEVTTAFLLRFKGRVRNVGDYDYMRWRLTAVDRRHVDTVPIPNRVIQLQEFPYSPDDSVGKAIPMIFGDFQTGNSFRAGAIDLSPMVCIDKNVAKYQISDHELFAYDAAFYRDSSGLVGIPYNSVTVVNAATGATIELATIVGTRASTVKMCECRFYVMPVGYGGFCSGTIGGSGNYRDALDGKLSTYYTLSNSSGSTARDSFAQISYGFQGKLLDFGGYHYVLHVECANRSGTTTMKWGKRATGNIVSIGTLNADSWSANINLGGDTTNYPNGWNWDDMYDTEVIFELANGASLDLKAVWWEVVARVPNQGRGSNAVSSSGGAVRTFGSIRYPYAGPNRSADWSPFSPKEAQTSWFMSCKGLKTTSAMTSGRSNGYATGDLIVNPAYVIEYILRERMGLVTADLDTASFDTVGNTTNGLRKGWLCAGVIAERMDSLEAVRTICQEFSLQLVVTNQAKYRLIAMDTRTEDVTIASSDIAFDPAGGYKAAVSMTGNDQIVNDLFLDYRTMYGDGNPVESIYLSDTDGDATVETNISTDSGSPRSGSYSTWVGDSRDRYGVSKPFRAVLRWIRDAATAEASLKKIADWNCFKRLVVELSLVRSQTALRLEVGDVVKLNDSIITDVHKNVTKFMVKRVNHPETGVENSPAWINLTLEEIPNTNSGLPVYSSRWLSSADLASV